MYTNSVWRWLITDFSKFIFFYLHILENQETGIVAGYLDEHSPNSPRLSKSATPWIIRFSTKARQAVAKEPYNSNFFRTRHLTLDNMGSPDFPTPANGWLTYSDSTLWFNEHVEFHKVVAVRSLFFYIIFTETDIVPRRSKVSWEHTWKWVNRYFKFPFAYLFDAKILWQSNWFCIASKPTLMAIACKTLPRKREREQDTPLKWTGGCKGWICFIWICLLTDTLMSYNFFFGYRIVIQLVR